MVGVGEKLMIAILSGFFFVSCGYQLVATILCCRFARRSVKTESKYPRFCLVKPLKSPHPQTLEKLSQFLFQTGRSGKADVYVCSASSGPSDWLEKHPEVTWLKVPVNQTLNGKASSLGLAQRYWSGDIFVISDADMAVRRDYLEAVLGAFDDPKVGVVTCLYRGWSERPGSGALLESLCIQDFAASVLVAERTEGLAFCLGSTMAVRRETLEAIGGFEALAEYLADDYQLGFRAVAKGWKVALAPTMTETDLGSPDWATAWAHQYRWMVTSRVSRPVGHAAFLITQGLLWAALLACWQPLWLLFWCFLRVALGTVQARALAGLSENRFWEPLFFPLKDVAYLLLWGRSLFGRIVIWGERELEIGNDGRIVTSRKFSE